MTGISSYPATALGQVTSSAHRCPVGRGSESPSRRPGLGPGRGLGSREPTRPGASSMGMRVERVSGGLRQGWGGGGEEQAASFQGGKVGE